VINDERAEHQRPSVELSARLAAAADRHAADMVARSYFEHDSLGGSTFVDRIRRTGYLPTDRSWVVGEILAWCRAECSTPRTIVSAWLASPPHRRVLLDPRFKELGVAIALGSPADADPTAATVAAEFGRVG
jgi:uncharacterized protein YkwD